MNMGVVADDVTGANDIGIMFAKFGLVTDVYRFDASTPLLIEPDAQVVILDTNARLDSVAEAYNKTFGATRALQAQGCTHFFCKTSSAFVGNVGAYFDAMLDALDETFAVVVVGFPKNGRLTREGIHFVHGKPLADSEFRNDPIHPMRESSLPKILQSQTRRRVGLVEYDVIAQGAHALRGRLVQLRGSLNYAILDVVDQAALATIAVAVRDEHVLCGSSALAEELPAVWEWSAQHTSQTRLPTRDEVGTLCLAGSLMPQTVAQIRYIQDQGVKVIELDSRLLLDASERAAELERVIGVSATTLARGQTVVVHAPNEPSKVERTRAIGANQGLSHIDVAQRVSQALGEVAYQISSRVPLNRLVVAGGETSNAVCAALGIAGMRVLEEIEAGLPVCVSLTQRPLLLVLKSGSFGSPDFIAKAIGRMEALS